MTNWSGKRSFCRPGGKKASRARPCLPRKCVAAMWPEWVFCIQGPPAPRRRSPLNLAIRRRRRAFFLDGAREGGPVVRHRLGELEKLGRQVLSSIKLDPQLAGLQLHAAGQILHADE